MAVEVWKSVVGLEGYYEVSNLGQVRSVDRTAKSKCGKFDRRREGVVMKQAPNERGYPSVNLKKLGKRVGTSLVHRLVATAFVPNPDNKPDVNHINAIKTDSSAKNLEWVTKQENSRHAWELGLFKQPKGVDSKLSKLTPELVQKAKDLRKLGHTYKSIAQLIGVSYTTTHDVINEKRWSHTSEN